MAQRKRYEITVVPKASYVADQSDPAKDHFVFSYTITITNTGEVAAQLVSRHWIITDGNGEAQEVRGPGVVGEQPLIAPGETHSYSSGTLMPTQVGSMRGSYQMVASDGHLFEAAIPTFRLAVPGSLH